jgi:hypothetical protein
MKKIIAFIISSILIILSFIIFNIFQTRESFTLKNIENTDFFKQFYIYNSNVSNQDFSDELKKLSSKYKVSFVHNSNNYNHEFATVKSVIPYEKTFPFKNFSLNPQNFFQNKNKTYSNFKINNKNNKLILKTFSNSNKLLIQSFDKYLNNGGSITGVYTATSNAYFDTQKLINEIASFQGKKSADLLTVQQGFSNSFLNQTVIISTILVIILLGILFVVSGNIVAYQSKKIGIKKILGFSNHKIFFSETSFGYLTSIIIASIILIFFVFYIKKPDHLFFVSLLFGYLIFLIIYSIMNILIFSSLERTSLASVVKNASVFKSGLFISYAVKTLYILFLTFFLISTGQYLTLIYQQWSYEKSYKNYQSYLAISDYKMDNNLISDWSLNTNNLTSNVGNEVFNYLNQNTNVLYAKGSILSSNYYLLSVNSNYAKQIGINANTKNSVYYLPEKLRFKESRIFKELQKNNTDNMNDKQKINIKYYKNIRPVFTFDSEYSSPKQISNQQITTENNTFNNGGGIYQKNPIILVNDMQKGLITDNQYLNNPFKLENTKSNRLAIKKLNQLLYDKYKVKVKFTKISLILSDMKNDLMYTFKFVSSGLILIFFVSIIMSVFWVNSIISNNKKKIAIQKMLGIGIWRRYKNIYIYLSVITVTQMITVGLIGKNLISILIVIGINMADILIILFTIKKIERQKIFNYLKGGKL